MCTKLQQTTSSTTVLLPLLSRCSRATQRKLHWSALGLNLLKNAALCSASQRSRKQLNDALPPHAVRGLCEPLQQTARQGTDICALAQTCNCHETAILSLGSHVLHVGCV